MYILEKHNKTINKKQLLQTNKHLTLFRSGKNIVKFLKFKWT